MMNQNEIMAKAMEMVKEGKTMEDALQFMLAEATKASAPAKKEGERATWMAASMDIQELRKAIKSSNGMKSKMSKNTVAVERYKNEITIGQERIKELNKIIAEAADPYAKAREFKADAADLLSIWLDKNKKPLEEKFEAKYKEKKITKEKAKEIRLLMDASTPPALIKELSAIGPDVLEAFEDRLKRGDQWMSTINKTYRFCGIEG